MDQFWTPEEVTAARDMWDAGRSCSHIAHALGNRTRNAVIGLAHRRNFPPRMVATRHINGHRGVPKAKAPVVSRPRGRVEHFNVPRKVVSMWRRPAALADIQPSVAPGANATAFLDIRPNQCRFPLWAGCEPIEEKLFCGNPVAWPTTSWCPACLERVLPLPRYRRVAA
jgi:hypothetical protein